MYELLTECERNCSLKPCYNCALNKTCLSFLAYRKEHPDYDEKYSCYVATHSIKQRSLCQVVNGEQVSQQDRRLRRDRTELSSGDIVRAYYIELNKGRTMRLDFSDVVESKQCALGEQELTIIKAEQKKSKNGTQMLVLDFHDAEKGFCRDQLMLEGAGAFKMKQFMEAAGLSEEEVNEMEASDFVGMNIVAEVVSEEYEGKVFSKIKKYMA